MSMHFDIILKINCCEGDDETAKSLAVMDIESLKLSNFIGDVKVIHSCCAKISSLKAFKNYRTI